MGMNRTRRVGDLVREVLAEVVRTEVADPAVGLASISEVRVSGDLRHAKVYVSHVGDERAREASIAALVRATPLLKREIGRRTRLRFVPELRFYPDEAIRRGQRVEAILSELKSERGGRPLAPDENGGEGERS